MNISKIRVARFRSIFEATLPCEPLTVLIGRNGAGKSAFLQALRLYFDPGAVVSIEDYYNRDTNQEILIEVTFGSLTSEEQSEFSSYIDSGSLVVQKRFPSGAYYGRVSGCPQLEPVRDKIRQKGSRISDAAAELKKFVDSGQFPGLQDVKSKVEEELDRPEKRLKTTFF